MPTQPPPREDTYMLDPESATEMARLMKQDQLITRGMGGIFAERPDLADVHDMLDVACGPGGWVLDVAFHYPRVKVVGVDISRLVIEYAHAQAWSRGLENASFQVMNVLKGLDFPDNSFDVVNARFIFGFMPRTAWPQLIQECLRVTRPGGVIRFTEPEPKFASTPAVAKMVGSMNAALKVAGMGFSPDGEQVGVVTKLGRLLKEAGCRNIGRKAHVIDFSSGEEAHHDFYQDYMIGGQLIRPFLLKTGVVAKDEYEQIYQQALVEMMSDEFCALWILLTAWGEKAAAH